MSASANQQRLELLSATVEAIENRGRVVDVIGLAADADEAKSALEQAFGWNEPQAVHVLSLPLMQFPQDALARARAQRDQLR